MKYSLVGTQPRLPSMVGMYICTFPFLARPTLLAWMMHKLAKTVKYLVCLVPVQDRNIDSKLREHPIQHPYHCPIFTPSSFPPMPLYPPLPCPQYEHQQTPQAIPPGNLPPDTPKTPLNFDLYYLCSTRGQIDSDPDSYVSLFDKESYFPVVTLIRLYGVMAL